MSSFLDGVDETYLYVDAAIISFAMNIIIGCSEGSIWGNINAYTRTVHATIERERERWRYVNPID